MAEGRKPPAFFYAVCGGRTSAAVLPPCARFGKGCEDMRRHLGWAVWTAGTSRR